MKEKKDPIIISLVCNILLVAGKGIAGILANSNALVADAINSMTDVISFIVNYRTCKDCQLYNRIDSNGTSKRIRQKIVDIETQATYYMGIFFFTIGMSICFHNFMILVLDRVEKPGPISIVVAFIALAVYVWLYKYSEDADNRHDAKDCVFTRKNTHWQNKMNLFSGVTVVIGLVGTVFGFIFMDELAAVVVGSILVGMGIKLIIESMKILSEAAKRHFKPVIISSIIISIVLTIISLSVQL